MFYIGIHMYCGDLFFVEICSRKFCLLTKKVAKFLPSKFSSIKILLYRRQDKERRLKTILHFSNNYLNNFLSSVCLSLQNFHGVPSVSVSSFDQILTSFWQNARQKLIIEWGE